jgi:amino acid transporter
MDEIFESVSNETLAVIAVVVVIFSVLLYAALYVSAYQERSKYLDKLKVKQKSGETLTETEKIEIEAGETFSWKIYGVSAILGAIATAVISIVAVLGVGDYLSIESTIYYGVVAIIVTIVIGALLDYLAVHRIADGEFYQKVVKPLNERFLAPATESVAETAKSALSDANIADALQKVVDYLNKKQ